jgi:hypothetical protein
MLRDRPPIRSIHMNARMPIPRQRLPDLRPEFRRQMFRNLL